MIQYCSAVEGLFGPDHPLTRSLLETVRGTGSTPVPPILSGFWNPVTGQAEMSWTESTNPDLQDFQVRVSPGQSHDAENSTIVATVPAGILSLSRTAGLESPGDGASFKVVLRLTTGHEASSNTV